MVDAQEVDTPRGVLSVQLSAASLDRTAEGRGREHANGLERVGKSMTSTPRGSRRRRCRAMQRLNRAVRRRARVVFLLKIIISLALRRLGVPGGERHVTNIVWIIEEENTRTYLTGSPLAAATHSSRWSSGTSDASTDTAVEDEAQSAR